MIERSMTIASNAREKMILIGAIAIIVEIKMTVGNATNESCRTPLVIAKAAAKELMQTTRVRMAGEIPKRMYSAWAHISEIRFLLFVLTAGIAVSM
jgi:hypothetical protein